MKRLTTNPIIAIGLVSLCINLSAVMVYSLTPLYLTEILGLSALSLGLLEGVVEMFAWSSRIVSGIITDYIRKRKPILQVAYIATTISRPIFALASGIYVFFLARSLDRIANGLQATARESLVGDLATPGKRGAAYGLRQSLSVTGSLLGGVVAWLLLDSKNIPLQSMFTYAAIPALFAVIILSIFVKEAKPAKVHTTSMHHLIKPIMSLFQAKHLQYWQIVLLAGVFMLGNYSGFFAILHAKSIAGGAGIAALVMIFQNLGGMLSAYPMGSLSDKGNRDKLLSIGFILAIISNSMFAIATNTAMVLLAAGLWGMQIGITQSILSAKIADATTSELRGSAFGLYYLIMGLMIFLSNTLMGWAYDSMPKGMAFYLVSSFALLALLILWLQSFGTATQNPES